MSELKPVEEEDYATVSGRFQRYVDAYLEMARVAKYRPGAPGDGFGSIDLTRKELANPGILRDEAAEYAKQFLDQDDKRVYPIGCPKFRENKAFFFVIEAARVMCGAWVDSDVKRARKLLELAIKKLDDPKGN